MEIGTIIGTFLFLKRSREAETGKYVKDPACVAWFHLVCQGRGGKFKLIQRQAGTQRLDVCAKTELQVCTETVPVRVFFLLPFYRESDTHR